MASLEDLKVGVLVQGILDPAVRVVQVEWHGSDALTLTYTDEAGRPGAEQEADFDAETRWALAWFEQHGMDFGPFGVAETLSKAKNTAVNGLVTAGIISSRAGKVRLLDRDELSVDWNPATDRRLTVWEVTQY